jgi:bifunctional UDP-N-acetylglucosamine pyrophosphorylase/glucosamine-1-phosphate N-acetyltransferase/UDP-N-acetylglucosamine pyrophosphorylase
MNPSENTDSAGNAESAETSARNAPVARGATAIVMAAGKGTRMKSELPKVLFPVLGRPMIHWVLDALQQVAVTRVLVVVGYRHEDVRRELQGRKNIEFVLQEQQLGTGHAVQMCVPSLILDQADLDRPVMVVAGDSPLVQPSSLSKLLDAFGLGDYSCLLGTLIKSDPQGLGRIVRDAGGSFERIIEQKDASADEVRIQEVNMSTYLFKQNRLIWALERLGNNNAQGEYYLTDCPALLKQHGERVDALAALEACEALSINTIDELEKVEDKMKELGYRCKS